MSKPLCRIGCATRVRPLHLTPEPDRLVMAVGQPAQANRPPLHLEGGAAQGADISRMPSPDQILRKRGLLR